MEKRARKRSNHRVITVESSREWHHEIIQLTVARRAYEIFERRGCRHGFHADDWAAAEKELLRGDFDGDTSQFHFFVECPRDSEVTTILSLTSRSLIVFRSHGRDAGKGKDGPDVISVHIFPAEIDTTRAEVNRVDGLLRLRVTKKSQGNGM